MPLNYIRTAHNQGENEMFSAQKENNELMVTIRFNGQYIAVRECFKAARNTINFDQWTNPERLRLAVWKSA